MAAKESVYNMGQVTIKCVDGTHVFKPIGTSPLTLFETGEDLTVVYFDTKAGFNQEIRFPKLAILSRHATHKPEYVRDPDKERERRERYETYRANRQATLAAGVKKTASPAKTSATAKKAASPAPSPAPPPYTFADWEKGCVGALESGAKDYEAFRSSAETIAASLGSISRVSDKPTLPGRLVKARSKVGAVEGRLDGYEKEARTEAERADVRQIRILLADCSRELGRRLETYKGYEPEPVKASSGGSGFLGFLLAAGLLGAGFYGSKHWDEIRDFGRESWKEVSDFGRDLFSSRDTVIRTGSR